MCVTKPVNCLDKERGTEWKAGVVLTDEDQADEFEKACTAIGAKPSLKKVKTAEFESIYKCAPPDEAERNVWVVTLRKNTKLGSTGKEVPELYRPRVMQREGNMLVDITNDPEKIVGNGSLGVLSVDLFERNDGKANIYLKNVLVEDLKAYKRVSLLVLIMSPVLNLIFQFNPKLKNQKKNQQKSPQQKRSQQKN